MISYKIALRSLELGLLVFSRCEAQPIQVSPTRVSITAPADTVFSLGSYRASLAIATAFGSGSRPFKFVLKPSYVGEPEFVIVSPASGIATANVSVALNPTIVPYMASGTYDLDLSFAPADDPSSAYPITLVLFLLGQGPPEVSSVVGAATMQPRISPGQAVSIFGVHLSTPPQTAQLSSAGVYPATLGNTAVTFSGISAPLLYVSNNQINCLVPYGVAGLKSVDVVVSRTVAPGVSSKPFTLPLLDTSPGIFSLDSSGTGQGLILNADPLVPNASSPNSASNPASIGSAITLFATGAGLWNIPYPDGAVALGVSQQYYAGTGFPLVAPKAPVSLTIGGQPAKLLYVAARIGKVAELQVNAIVPDGIGSGDQPIVLKIGDNDNSQQLVTIAIK